MAKKHVSISMSNLTIDEKQMLTDLLHIIVNTIVKEVCND